MDKIQGLSGLNKGFENPLLKKVRESSSSNVSFGDQLKEAVRSVDKLQQVSDTKLEMLASGKEVDIHGTMIALKEAELSLRVMGTFRDKFVEAYKNLMTMAI
jgi:flagellar hook-basal body complex protein FliE